LQAEITQRRRVEQELNDHRQELERANTDLALSNRRLAALYQTAQRFVDNVSHEFRTPLTVIKGYAEAVGEGMAGPINTRQKEFLGYVVDRTRDLAQMVDDLLDSSKLRAGTLRIDRQRHPIEAIFAPIRPILHAKAAACRVRIEEQFAEGLPEVFTDVEKAGRVVMNLAINAIKFSPEEQCVILWARPSAEGSVVIGVSDHGPGISPENLELIFDRFKQLGDAQSGTTKGFGLGLNIARELAALNLGELRVASVLSQGSTFSFTLPPNDPEVILRRYLAYLRALPSIDPEIGLLRVAHATHEAVSERLHKFIASAIRPTDLILPSGDRTSLLLVGATSDAGSWADRLSRAAEAFQSRLNPSHSLGELVIQPIEQWPYPGAAEQVWEGVLHHVKGEYSYA
jgi:nitrogen-specific signal transduction histidine kinase